MDNRSEEIVFDTTAIDFITLIFFILGLILFSFFLKERSSDNKFKFALFIFCILTLSLYFESNITNIPLTLLYCIILLISGFVLYIIFSKIELKLLHSEYFNQNNLHKTRMLSFGLLLLIWMSIFSGGALVTLNDNNYQIDQNSLTVSQDFSEIAYLTFNNNKPFLLLRNVDNPNNFTSISISDMSCVSSVKTLPCYKFPAISSPNEFSIKLYNTQKIVLLIPNSPSDSSYFYILNLTSNRLMYVYYYYGSNLKTLLLNSSLYFVEPGSLCELMNVNDQSAYNFTYKNSSQENISVNKLFPAPDCYFSPDFTKLVLTQTIDNGQQYSIGFFNVVNFTATLTYFENLSIVGWSIFELMNWENDFVHFIIYSGDSTSIYSFNFTNTTIFNQGVLPGTEGYITSIDTNDSILTTGYNFRIYSLKNFSLLMTDPSISDSIIWNGSHDEFIGFSNNKLILMKYNPTINSLIVIKELDTPINPLVLQFYNDMFTAIVGLTLLTLFFVYLSRLKEFLESLRT